RICCRGLDSETLKPKRSRCGSGSARRPGVRARKAADERAACYITALGNPCPLMGHRLSKIYTRTGDGGDTGLGDGSRTRKDSPRVAALGEIDELNSAIGVLLAEPMPEKIRASLQS